jgi:molecular chaperone DnaJ
MPKDFYKILGVAENASDDDLKKAYRKLAKQYHPDANAGDKDAENKFKEISEAYSVLSDKQKRIQYDQMRRFGASGFGGGGARPGGFPGGFGGFDFGQGGGATFSFEDLGGFGSLGDIFSSLFGDQVPFGKRGRRRRQTGPRKGNNLAATIEITFDEMVKGVKKTIKLNREANCDRCNGTGSEPGSAKSVCPVCNGRGVTAQSVGGFSVSRPCPRCLGKGEVVSEPCSKCGGTGKIRASQKVAIRVPPCVEHGAKLKLKGLGQAGAHGGANGDLMVRINVKHDRFFTRVGRDLVCTVPISLRHAVDGAKIKVRTMTGHVTLNIPPGTADGTKFNLRNLGIEKGGVAGNQYVTVKVDIPKNPSAEEQELLNKLNAKETAEV